jgi:hypothetical protein
LLVHYPHNNSLSPTQATIVAIILWTFSLLISLPYGYNMGLEEYEGYCGQVYIYIFNNFLKKKSFVLNNGQIIK